MIDTDRLNTSYTTSDQSQWTLIGSTLVIQVANDGLIDSTLVIQVANDGLIDSTLVIQVTNGGH